MTRDDIVEIAARHADKHTVGRMKMVMDKFKTVSEFLAAGDGALMGAYNAARPGRPHGLGRQFFRAMERFCRAMKVDIYAAIGGLNA
jgi:hypothetical protein